MIHVCSLAALPGTVKATGASHVLTVMANVNQVRRPESVLEANHLRVSMDDITEHMDGFVAPNDSQSEKIKNKANRNKMNVVKSYNNWRAYRNSVAELSSLSNRSLADLGISRADIRVVARRG